jgi:sugar (pentulose or hexulose) kinase
VKVLIGTDEGTSAVKAAMFDLTLNSTRCTMPTSSPAASIIGGVGDCLGPGKRPAALADRDLAGQALPGRLETFDPQTLATVTARSGLPVDPYISAGKVAWLLEQGLPDDVCIGTVDAYLCAQFGAGFATDLSTASRAQLAQLGERVWDDELCTIFGVRPPACPACATASASSTTSAGAPSCRCALSLWTSRQRPPEQVASCRAGARQPSGPGFLLT